MDQGTDQLAGSAPRADLRVSRKGAPFPKVDVGKPSFHIKIPPEKYFSSVLTSYSILDSLQRNERSDRIISLEIRFG
jgi:hypothetical protein